MIVEHRLFEGAEKNAFIARPDFRGLWGERVYRAALVAPHIEVLKHEPWQIELRIPNAQIS